LDYALESGDKELAIACLDMGAAVDRDDERFPPLYYAIERADKDLTMFDLLLARGVNPNIRFMNDHTPLHVCAIDDKPRAVERLLAANADANAETRIDDYFTPLMEASSRGHVGIVQQLLQAGANPDFVNLCGQTVISVAAKRSREQIKEAISTFKRKHTTKE
jgi:ankyrin repeat protein